MATAYYAGASGFDRFDVDAGLRSALARLFGDPARNGDVAFEFAEGVEGFTVAGADGRQVKVSPESIRSMARAWAGEEFRELYVRLGDATQDASD